MRILITGVAGFIGWNLSRHLRERHPDAEIVGIDNLWTGVRRRQEYFNHIVELPVEQPAWLAGKFDYVYHLASPASPRKYQSRPLDTISANVQGLMTCLTQYMRDEATLFFASSSEVYGDPLVSPQPESYKGQVSCTGPRACYDESKRLCETICTEWGRANPTHRTRIARLFNVYGPGTLPDDGRCVSNFVWEAMHDRPLSIYGDGRQTRCFTYVDDVVPAIVRLAEEVDWAGPVNIGTSQETTVQSMATTVLTEVAHSHGEVFRISRDAVQYVEAAVDDPCQRLPDLTLANRLLGWRTAKLVPIWGERGGVRRLIEHFREEYRDDDDLLHNDTQQTVQPADAGDTPGVDRGADGAVGTESRA